MVKCVICGRDDHNKKTNEYGEPLCRQHLTQYIKYGRFFKWNINRENEYIERDNHYEIILRNRKMDQVGVVFVDKDDFDKVIQYKWKFSGGYANCSRRDVGFMHTLILDKKDGLYIDHINRNRLDNRKQNLRYVDGTINGFNKGKQSNNTSGYVGVSWEKNRNKWEAHIKKHGKKKFLGYYSEIEDAVNARREAELEYYGEYRNPEYDKHTVFKKEEPTT